MAKVCKKCSRPNPDDAAYCYFDGHAFAATVVRQGAVDIASQPFATPFVFPSGKECRCFNELALYCWRHWGQARDALQKGLLEPFLGRLGRVDLAMAAHQAAEVDDKDRGLDELLARLPSKSVKGARLHVDREQVDLGRMKIGDSRQLTIHLQNQGTRLLQGNIACEECVWLALGDGAGVANKHFAFTDKLTIPVQVRGDLLRAGNKPLVAQIVVESNGGNATITVTADVPTAPFPSGSLAGATTPKQLAEKAVKAPREAAQLFEKGAIAAWYKDNGWDYPVKIPTASSVAAIQQFFEALGLTAAPKVKIQPTGLKFKAKPGARLEQNLEITTEEKRAIWAHAITDQSWLKVTKVSDGKTAVLHVEIPQVPERPGEVLRGKITVLSNGRKRFVVLVLLGVIGVKPKKPKPDHDTISDSSRENETIRVGDAVEIVDAEEVVEIVDAVEVQSEPLEMVEPVEIVEAVDIPDASAADNAQPEVKDDEQAPLPDANEPTGDPFAFDEEDVSALKRKKDDSVISKLFGRKKN
jgi:hypothetical protein